MFFLFFIAIPLIEVILFITVGKYIGLWNTIFIIIITGVIGAILVKSQGISILNKAFDTNECIKNKNKDYKIEHKSENILKNETS